MEITMKMNIDAKKLTRVPADGKYSNHGNSFPIPYVVRKAPTPGMPERLYPVQSALPVLRGEEITGFQFSRFYDENGVLVKGVYGLTALKFDANRKREIPVVTVSADKKTAERLYRFIKSRWDWDYSEGTLSVRGAEAIYKETAEKVLTGIFE